MPLFIHPGAAILRAPLLPVGSLGDPFDERGRFRLGMLAAVPGFLQQLDDAYLADRTDPKLQRTLRKYQLRAAGRCTPFGCFAGLCLIRATDSPDARVILAGPDKHHLRLQADAAWLAQLAGSQAAVSLPGRRFRINDSLYRAGNQIRYATARAAAGNICYDLSSVPAEDCLLSVLDIAAGGASGRELLDRIEKTARVSAIAAADYLGALIDAQVLRPEALPPLTGNGGLGTMLTGADTDIGFRETLDDLSRLLAKDDPAAAGFSTILDTMTTLIPARNPLDPALQIDMHLRCLKSELPRSRLDYLMQELEDLTSLAIAYHLPLLDDFKQRFAERYEGAAVSLLEALDPDLGIGYGPLDPAMWTGDLLAGLPLPTASAPRPKGNAKLEAFVRRKFLDALRNGETEIVIHPSDLMELPQSAPHVFARSQALMGSMEEDTGADDWRFSLEYAGGASALALIGRFCNGSRETGRLAAELIAMETAAEPRCVLAEIVHLPAATLGNVSRRPVLREYEIPYLGVSGAPPENQLSVSDLYLQLHGDELCLFSRRLAKRVLPRLSTAHNFAANALPLYRLLCELQFQGLSQPLSWDWGVFRDEAFLPAVRYGHIRLRNRSWRFDAGSLAAASAAEFQTQLSDRGVPRFVRCGLGDQRLLLDLRDPEQAELLMRELRGNANLRVEDAGQKEGPSFVQNADGESFANELIIPVINTEYRSANDYELSLIDPEITRVFPPGLGPWHYLKIYCGFAAGDSLLREGLERLCEWLIDRRLISHWFFVRYLDPEPQLRLRFCLIDPGLRPRLESVLQTWLRGPLENGVVQRLVQDTYRRELERYGAEHIEAAERLFFADSRCTLAFLSSEPEGPDETARFRFACGSIHALCTDAGLDINPRRDLFRSMAAAFFDEQGGEIPLQQGLNAQYRSHRAFFDLSPEAWTERHGAIINARGEINRELFSLIGDAQRRMLPDLIHMLVNRIFIAEQRRYELLIYHCLAKYYASRCARCRPTEVR